ncbi:ABC transporter permease [Elioraea tepida]|jgi:putative spermidine/putrescine transport system permease protein|uniref:ABC transporter permease n=1 Tax=Elioraea tepida TaxID=2843330 RepID=A0A975U2V7_9PROT|nr:ABC transporter permease [Elioraea tepida]QXM25340.1 ABC transporter permease [Elioraea tepida]
MDRSAEAGPVATVLAWSVLLFLLLPITVIFPISLTDQRFLSLPYEGLSLQHYVTFFTSERWLSATWQSLVIAVASTVLAVAAGTLCAIGCWKLSTRATELVRALMLLPIIVPSIVYALGIYRFWIRLDLLDTYLGVILVHGVTGIPYVVITVSASLASFDPRLEQAARGMGASLAQTLAWVILPRIMPGIVSGSIFAFIHSWDEAVLILFIASRALFTLPRRMWDGINENLDPVMAVAACVMILASMVALAVDLWVRRRRDA